METLRNYLENMFMNMPKTEKVMKAKIELGQMMEDRYNELIEEGKSENEAAGIVISEFGNLEELASELGIDEQFAAKNTVADNAHPMTMEDSQLYIHDTITASRRIGLGVFFIITSPAAIKLLKDLSMTVSLTAFYVLIAAGIALFVYSSVSSKNWKFVKQEMIQLDFETANYVRGQREGFRIEYAAFITSGVVLIITSVIPLAVIRVYYASIGQAFFFIMVGLGVMFIVMARMRLNCYDRLLGDTAKDKVDMQDDIQSYTPAGRKILSVYWPTAACLYLCWSFLSFDWGITWVVWPIAAVAQPLIKAFFKKEEY